LKVKGRKAISLDNYKEQLVNHMPMPTLWKEVRRLEFVLGWGGGTGKGESEGLPLSGCSHGVSKTTPGSRVALFCPWLAL
jgi:hypothetical protein